MTRHKIDEAINLKAYPSEEPHPRASDITLRSQITTQQDARESTRRRFGRSISMDVIENALMAAQRGSMRDITDLSRETIDTDPHLGAVLVKRFSAIKTSPTTAHRWCANSCRISGGSKSPCTKWPGHYSMAGSCLRTSGSTYAEATKT